MWVLPDTAGIDPGYEQVDVTAELEAGAVYHADPEAMLAEIGINTEIQSPAWPDPYLSDLQADGTKHDLFMLVLPHEVEYLGHYVPGFLHTRGTSVVVHSSAPRSRYSSLEMIIL